MRPTEDYVPDPDSDCESPQGTWFYNQGRSRYTVQLNEDEEELCYYQQMAKGTILRGVLTPPSSAADQEPTLADGEEEDAAPFGQEELPWMWEAVLSNQARIRLRREGEHMVSSYQKPGSDGWTAPQRADRRQRLTGGERHAYKAFRLRQLLLSEFVECSSMGRPLGLCRECSRCPGWTARQLPPKRRELFAAAADLADSESSQDVREARGNELHSLSDPVPNFDGVRFEFPRSPWDGQPPRTESKEPCGYCGYPESAHEDASRRLGRFMQRADGKRTNIPLAALRWTQLELALWSDTGGLFRPQAPSLRRKKAGRCEVSVICPTTASRRCFHPFLWSCFHSQTVQSRELVIIETCQDGPSPFFEEKANADDRVVYKYFHLPPWQWSIGVKRNLAIYFSSGRVIAHFDDDDLYAPVYLEEMLKCLRDPREAFALHAMAKLGENHYLNMLAGLGFRRDLSRLSQAEAVQGLDAARASSKWLDEDFISNTLAGSGAALAKLSCWHTFSIVKQGWGYFDAVGGDDEPLADVSNSLYGWGFSMVYLRSVWEVCPFLHMNLGEDFDFAKSIRKLNFPVVLVPDRRGICAHTHHSDNTAGGQQFFDYGTTSSLLYSPMGGMITGYTHAIKALQTFQEQAVEEGKSRRDALGKLRAIAADGSVVEEQADASPTEDAKPAAEEPKAKPPPRVQAPPRKVVEAPPPQPPPCRFCVVSSVDGYRSKEEMAWDGSCFRYSGALTAVGAKVQLLKNGLRETALYPSVPDADLNTAHVLRGPDKGGQGQFWKLKAPAGKAKLEGECCEVVLSCPEGLPLSLTWTYSSEESEVPAAGSQAASKPQAGAKLADWRLLWELDDRGQAGASVFVAETEGGQQGVVKCPASLPEMQHLAAMQGVPGVPALLACGGSAASGSAFHVTPHSGQSLQKLLAGCDHDGRGGRIPWAAAQCLGRMVLTALRGIHARGLVLGGLSPSGICVHDSGTQVSLVDFGQSRPFWAEASGELQGVNGECDSIRAGFSDDRSPADDLESLGWLLWKCVVGVLPWSRLAASLGSKSGEERRAMCERIAKAKRAVFRAGSSAFGQRFNHFPAELEGYLRCVRGVNSLGGLKATKYTELMEFLTANESQPAWSLVVRGCSRDSFEAEKGRVIWRAAGTSSSLDADVLSGPAAAFGVACTGRTELLHGGRWAEVDRVWAPGMPPRLLEERGWVLVADWAGVLLVPGLGGGAADAEAADRAETELLTSVLGPLAAPKGRGAHHDADGGESDLDEADAKERERQIADIAATAARQYVKATAFQQ